MSTADWSWLRILRIWRFHYWSPRCTMSYNSVPLHILRLWDIIGQVLSTVQLTGGASCAITRVGTPSDNLCPQFTLSAEENRADLSFLERLNPYTSRWRAIFNSTSIIFHELHGFGYGQVPFLFAKRITSMPWSHRAESYIGFGNIIPQYARISAHWTSHSRCPDSIATFPWDVTNTDILRHK